MTSRTKLVRKAVDDVLGGEETWKHADSTMGRLPFFFSENNHLHINFQRLATSVTTTKRISISYRFGQRMSR
jgi:hypothetical protein